MVQTICTRFQTTDRDGSWYVYDRVLCRTVLSTRYATREQAEQNATLRNQEQDAWRKSVLI